MRPIGPLRLIPLPIHPPIHLPMPRSLGRALVGSLLTRFKPQLSRFKPISRCNSPVHLHLHFAATRAQYRLIAPSSIFGVRIAPWTAGSHPALGSFLPCAATPGKALQPSKKISPASLACKPLSIRRTTSSQNPAVTKRSYPVGYFGRVVHPS